VCIRSRCYAFTELLPSNNNGGKNMDIIRKGAIVSKLFFKYGRQGKHILESYVMFFPFDFGLAHPFNGEYG
jgi:hypothetical protein